nr:MAG TPA: hypothetical protein [Caudoviricetes sp.]
MTDTLSAEIIVVDKASTILQHISQSTETLIR